MKKISKKALALSLATVMAVPALPISSLGTLDAQAAESISRVMVHDPSIFEYNDEYYVFGSHIATAKSSDLVNWTQVSTDYQSVANNPIYGNVKENLAESFTWAGYDDGDCKGGYAVWAPDVIYNPNYVWADGHKGAYMLYYSASSTWRRSCIGYMVSDRADGGYTYGGTVVYSGFTNTGKVNYDGNSTRDTTYTNDYLPFNKLIEEGKIDGDVSTWKCFNSNGSWNNNYAPNAIDPTLFYDATGEHLYMVYGSWSGGIYLLELDPTTGLVIHPKADEANNVDAYFGKKLLGGGHISIEGPYIMYDEATDYYYLFVSYGGLTSNGGYQIRVFRSKTVDGEYVDMNGSYPTKSAMHQNFGLKLSGNYKLPSLDKAYMATGHNSAFIDDDGKMYVVYHTRFNDGTENHSPRVHQMLMNEEGWPCDLPYQTQGETVSDSGYSKDDVVGRYYFINQGTDISNEIANPRIIYLNLDGSVEGEEVSGTWTMKDNTYYMRISLSDKDYSGVFCKMKDEAGTDVFTFSAVGSNESVWGVKYE